MRTSILNLKREKIPEASALMERYGAPQSASAGDLAAAAEHTARMGQTGCATVRLEVAKRHEAKVSELDAFRADAVVQERQGNATPPQPDPRGRVDLLVDEADLPHTAAELARLLAQVPHIFDRGGPVRLVRDAQGGCFVLEPLTLHGVINEAHRICRPWKWTTNRNGVLERRNVTLSDRVAKLYLDDRANWGLRPLDGITSAPLLHDDGSLRSIEGYDAETRLWVEPVPALTLPERPSRADAEAAMVKLRQHFRTFAFADAERVVEAGMATPVVDVTKPPGQDESAFLCALLTAVCRPCLGLAPGSIFRAPEYSGSGTGKGLLVRAIAAIAFDTRPMAITAGGNVEELGKRIASILMEAGPVVFLDNVNSTALKSDVLASALTERPAAVRPLGRSAIVPLNPLAFVAVTGNGLLLSEDMTRRFVIVELDAGTEDPEARDFRGDFLAETMDAREQLLSDALTICRWGRQQGDRLPSGCALGSYNQWSRWCRDPLLELGCKDPVLRVAEAKAKDPRRQRVGEIFRAWERAHGTAPVSLSALAEPVRAIADPDGRGRQFLASVILKLEGTRAAGFVMRCNVAEGHWTRNTYSLTKTEEHGKNSDPYAPLCPPMASGPEGQTAAGVSVPPGWSDEL